MSQKRRQIGLAEIEDNADGPLLRVSQVRTILGLSGPTLNEIIEAGDIRGSRIGRTYKVVYQSLRDYLFTTGVLPLRPNEREGMKRHGVEQQPVKPKSGPIKRSQAENRDPASDRPAPKG